MLEQQLAELMTMPPAQLRSLWRDTYRSPAPDIGPDLLRRGIANRLQERVHCKLSSAAKREIERRAGDTDVTDHLADRVKVYTCIGPKAEIRKCSI
jgi:hypothetical protein